jgi:hypothetical protein
VNTKTVQQKKTYCHLLDLEKFDYFFMQQPACPVSDIRFSNDKKYAFVCKKKTDCMDDADSKG